MAAAFPQRSILLIALAAMGIAVLLPFDQGLRVVSFGHLPIHVLLVGALALAGGWFAQKAGCRPLRIFAPACSGRWAWRPMCCCSIWWWRAR
jgi:hypothetical protein